MAAADDPSDRSSESDPPPADPDAPTPPTLDPTRELDLQLPPGLPKTVGPFAIERLLGRGGMGAVYLGVDPKGKRAAVKVLPVSFASEPGLVERFMREIDALGKMKNEHIVRLLGRGTEQVAGGGEYPFYAMELVEGPTLAEAITERGRLPWTEVVEIGVQTCKALKVAHNAGIIHRDLKPSNLMLAPTADGSPLVKLTDFGVAQTFASGRLTATGGMVGTAEYMSPEQADGRRVTKQSDLYSLGAVLYAAVTGRPPFGGSNPLDVAQKHRAGIFDSPKRLVPEIPRWLDEAICECLAKAPEDRPADAYVLQRQLAAIPAKVTLSQSEETQHATAAAVGVDAGLDGKVAGTLVARMVRDEIERQQEASPVSRLLDNTAVLLTLLALSLAAIVWFAQRRSDRGEARFAAAVELLDSERASDWRRGTAILRELRESDPARWDDAVRPYAPQMALADTTVRRTLGSSPDAPDEPTRLLLEARAKINAQQYADAVATLVRLQDATTGDARYEALQTVIVQELDSIDHDRRSAARDEFIRDRLDAADELEADGRIPSARRVRRAIRELYSTPVIDAARKSAQPSEQPESQDPSE